MVAPMSATSRDRTIDGFRAIAALGVVFSHAVTFRFANSSLAGMHYLQKLAGSLSQTSVQIFFVVSGYIITSLLLGEERKRGRISVPAFYIRRACRILPPLMPLFATIIVLRYLRFIELDNASLISSMTFTCNLGFVDCGWWVAHTWSLAVEEQFYLLWPMLLILTTRRPLLLACIVACLLTIFVITPPGWHNNYVSFACIAMGALYAAHEPTRTLLQRQANYFLWIVAGALLILGPPFLPTKLSQSLMPFLIPYLIFAGRELAIVRTVLAWKPIQAVGLASYSLYLWQQLFLAKPSLYLGPVFPVWLLPLVVFLSVVLIEQPFIRLGRRLSAAAIGRQDAKTGLPPIDDYGVTMPAP
jgi:peptidoglycan/LPS O-acetylase OafA/YrhL